MSNLSSFIGLLKAFVLSNPLLWACCAVSFLVSVILIPCVIRVCTKRQWFDSVNERKIHKGQVPRLGSIGFVAGFAVGCFIFIVADKDSGMVFMPLIFAGLLIFAFGIADDMLDLNAFFKLLVQCVAALIIVMNGYTFSRFFSFELPRPLDSVFTFFWIIGIINAYNLIDGLDGLCGGLSVLTVFTYGIIFTQAPGCYAAVCLILVASVAGFLLYNRPMARIFMGDGGSQFLGFVIAVLPLFRTTANFEQKKLLIALNLVSVPMFDCIAAIWRRTREHRGIMSPDREHLHHKLMNLGLSGPQVLALLLAIQAFLCICTGISMGIKTVHADIFLVAVFVCMLVFFSAVHYANQAKMRAKS